VGPSVIAHHARAHAQELAQTVTESLKQKKGVALLLTEKDKTTPLLKSLAISFQVGPGR
jgi:hypothetical protein